MATMPTKARKAPLGGGFIAVGATLGIIGTLTEYLTAGIIGISLWRLLSEGETPGGMVAGVLLILAGVFGMICGALVALVANARAGGTIAMISATLAFFGYGIFVFVASQETSGVAEHFADIAGPGSYLVVGATVFAFLGGSLAAIDRV